MCNHNRTLRVSAKCSDLCVVQYTAPVGNDIEHDGYVPSGIGIDDDGYGDYVQFDLCMDCGKIVTKGVEFPISDSKIRKALEK